MSENSRTGPQGREAIVYQHCAACGAKQYFRRSFCAACGAPDPEQKRASGEGTVYATSLVCRAATPETRAHVPYNILLVDTAEGFRMMAHGDNELAIGDKVAAQLQAVCGTAGAVFCESEVNWWRSRDAAQRKCDALLKQSMCRG